jgi:stearoyl-CoA desaturase (delta-9 desaturase)
MANTVSMTENDSSLPYALTPQSDSRRIRLYDVLPILSIHLIGFTAIFTGFSWTAVAVAAALFWARMLIITAFYHRYFSHRTFRTHRITQFLAAAIGTTCAQRGPVWWAAHHREHHQHSDDHPDPHSPGIKGLLFSHVGWFLTQRGQQIDWGRVPDWKRYPELVFIERWHMAGAFVLTGLLFAVGFALERLAPGLHTTGPQLVTWGFGISTTLLYHATFTINSLAHTIGSQRFNTGDDSRNNWFLAIITLGEGWHNNHHYYPGTARQGFYWYEFDPAFWALRTLSMFGIVWDLRPVPAKVYAAAEEHRRQRKLSVDRPGVSP